MREFTFERNDIDSIGWNSPTPDALNERWQAQQLAYIGSILLDIRELLVELLDGKPNAEAGGEDG